jgi:hypothetical protein
MGHASRSYFRTIAASLPRTAESGNDRNVG